MKNDGEINLKEIVPKSPPLREAIRKLLARKSKQQQRLSLVEICNAVACSPKQALKELDALHESGFNLEFDPEQKVELSPTIPKQDNIRIKTGDYFGDDWVRFGFVADSHLASKYSRLDVINALYDVYEREGIHTVYHGGNWIDGDARFNKYDVHCVGFENQLTYFLKHYPRRKKIKTHLISGDDHEGWYVQREQINVGRVMEARAKEEGRDDLIDLGYMERDLEFSRGNGQSVIRIIHAGGGSAYAISYTSQKYVESLQGGEKPAIVLVGHFHKFDWSYPREVHVIQGGCFTGNTKITTDSGQKRIKDIKIGDRVLTHCHRFMPVTNLMRPRLADDFYALNYGRKGRPDQTLTGTSEHPIWVECGGERSWMPMKEIIPGDFVFVSARKCRVTGEPIPYWMNLSKHANPMDEARTRQKLSATKGGFHKERACKGSGWTYDYDDESGFVKVPVLSCRPTPPPKQRKRETVYNFEVAEDNSYVAGNVVVHNCTQDQTPFMRKRRIQAMVGGCIIEAKQDRRGAFNRVRVEFMPFYDKKYYNYQWQ